MLLKCGVFFIAKYSGLGKHKRLHIEFLYIANK